MPTFTWDGGPKPTSESWVIENTDISGGVSITGAESIISSTSERWKASIGFRLVASQVPWFRAKIASLRGRWGDLLIGPYHRAGAPIVNLSGDQWAIDLLIVDPVSTGYDTGEISGTIGVAAALRASSVTIQTAAGQRPIIGAYIGMNDRLYVITNISYTSLVDTVCEIRPTLRGALIVGTVVDFINPLCLMKLSTHVKELPWSASTNITEVTLELVETRPFI